MPKKKRTTGTSCVDPDDAPELTKDWFEHADIYDGDKLSKRGRGRPPLERPKEQVTLRLDADVIAAIQKAAPAGRGGSMMRSHVSSKRESSRESESGLERAGTKQRR
jgi:uncharacterized protein (DUF4415 family)